MALFRAFSNQRGTSWFSLRSSAFISWAVLWGRGNSYFPGGLVCGAFPVFIISSAQTGGDDDNYEDTDDDCAPLEAAAFSFGDAEVSAAELQVEQPVGSNRNRGQERFWCDFLSV